jgi:beta-N-acetylhexosaminidase
MLKSKDQMKPRPASELRRKCALLLLTAILTTGLVQSGTQTAARAKTTPPVKPYFAKPSKEALQWADKELRRMSLDEKIGQLVSVGINATFLNQDSEAFKELRHQVEDNHVGGIILFRGPVYESVVLVNRMQARARYPLLISADLEAGAGMRFDDTINLPWNMAVGATDNPEYARRQGALTARESRALGVQQIYAPVADVNNNAANPVINVRSYGEDPAAVGRFVAAFVEGAQSNGVISTAKHFPGHGDTATDSHRGLPEINVSRDRLNAVELVPFRAAVKVGVGSVMTGHIGMPKIDPTAVVPLPRDIKLKPIDTDESAEVVMEKGTMPTTLSPVMNGILRRDLGFDGLIVTDAMSMSGLTLYFTQAEASVRALEAGADLLLKPADPDAAISGVKEAVLKGRLKEQRINESARRVLAAKFDLGLVKQRITPLDEIDMNVAGHEAVNLANEIAEHAITLVRNDDNLVPQRSLKPDARIFNLAITNGDDRLWIANTFSTRIGRQLLSLTGEVGEPRKVETVVLDDRSTDAEVQKALERAKGADLIVASLYGRVRTGQARSLGLPEAGAKALSGLISSKTPFVAISFGNPYLLQSFPELRTYMVAYGDMPSLQQAAARALLGEIDISGKLPISLPGLYPRGTGIQLKR